MRFCPSFVVFVKLTAWFCCCCRLSDEWVFSDWRGQLQLHGASVATCCSINLTRVFVFPFLLRRQHITSRHPLSTFCSRSTRRRWRMQQIGYYGSGYPTSSCTREPTINSLQPFALLCCIIELRVSSSRLFDRLIIAS